VAQPSVPVFFRYRVVVCHFGVRVLPVIGFDWWQPAERANRLIQFAGMTG